MKLEIKPGEFIGVCGRTGSGKSSLFRALLRLTELNYEKQVDNTIKPPEDVVNVLSDSQEENGSIYIDGINIREIGLDTLRSSISLIPQDSVLFAGTIRLIFISLDLPLFQQTLK